MTATTRAERRVLAAARAALIEAALPSAERCWVYWHSVGRPPVRCTVRPDRHDGPHDFSEEPTTRTDAFGETVCADCGYHDGQHGEDCHA